MATDIDIAPDLRKRVEAIAARSNLTASEVIADALQNGHSLDWQEQFLDKVAQGVEAADRGEFASAADIARIRNKYRPS
jgi:predicted transcriptional regulator